MSNKCFNYRMDQDSALVSQRLSLLESNGAVLKRIIDSLGCIPDCTPVETEEPTVANSVNNFFLVPPVNQTNCSSTPCSFKGYCVGYDNFTTVVASTSPMFDSNLVYAYVNSDGSYSLSLSTDRLYYIRAVKGNSLYTNVLTTTLTVNTVPVSIVVPTIISPVNNSVSSAGVFPYTFPWSCIKGISDPEGYPPYAQVSLSSDFSTVDGVAGTRAYNGGYITIYEPGTFYLRASNDNKNWSTVFTFTVKSNSDTGSSNNLQKPVFSLPVNNYIAKAVAYPYGGLKWQLSTAGSSVLIDISKNLNFSTSDGYSDQLSLSYGKISVTSAGSFYMRGRYGVDGPYSDTISFKVTTVDISGIVIAEPSLSTGTNNTVLVLTVPQVLSDPTYGTTYTGIDVVISTDTGFSNIVISYTTLSTGDNYTPVSLYTKSFMAATPGTTYYCKVRLQIDGVWSAWSVPVSHQL